MAEVKEESSGNKGNEEDTRSKRWEAVLYYLHINLLAIGGLYLLFFKAKWMTVFYFFILVTSSSIALTVGAHRLYAHQTFVASWQVKLFIMLAHTLAGVGSIYDWVFWHRMHHKYYGTERDPYNHKKGFLYSHVFSNLLSAPSDINTYARDIDMRDVDSDTFVWMQRKFYWIFFFVFGLLLPINVAMEYWEETPWNAIIIIGITRLAVTTNISWLVNSALLVWGLKRGDKFPVDDNSVFFLNKSYWLNYHYMVPWDWKNDEFGTYERGFATFIIKMWRELGLVNEMKTTSTEEVREALYKVASSKMTLKEAVEELEKNAKEAAHNQKLMYHH